MTASDSTDGALNPDTLVVIHAKPWAKMRTVESARDLDAGAGTWPPGTS